MALGYEVTKPILDSKCAEAVLALRAAFDKIDIISSWLGNHPVVDNIDPLVSEFDYTVDEAYALRLYFETFESIRVSNANTFDIGRKMTGLM